MINLRHLIYRNLKFPYLRGIDKVKNHLRFWIIANYAVTPTSNYPTLVGSEGKANKAFSLRGRSLKIDWVINILIMENIG